MGNVFITPGSDTSIYAGVSLNGGTPQAAYSIEYDIFGIKTNLVVPLTSTNDGNNAGVKAVVGNSNSQTTQQPISAEGNIQSSANVGYNIGTGWWIGFDKDIPKLFIGTDSGNKITWDGDTLSITGNINATTGTIGGFEIGVDYIRDTGNDFGLSSNGTSSSSVRFWAGDTFANRATAPFRVTVGGALVATNATISGTITATSGTIGGWSVGSTTLTGGGITLNSSTGTITGGTIRTSSSGARVQMLSSSNTMQILDSSSVVRAESFSNGWQFNNASGVASGKIFIEATFGNLELQAIGADLFLTSANDITFAPDNGSIIAYLDSGGLHMNADIDMNASDIIGVDDITMDSTTSVLDMNGGRIDNPDEIRWQSQSSNPTGNGRMRYYVNSGITEMRIMLSGNVYRFVLETPPP